MNLRTIDRVFSQSWHILPSAFETLTFALLQEEGTPGSSQPEYIDKRPTVDFWGDEIDSMHITADGLAIIPIHGPLLHGATGFDKYRFGFISHEDIADDLDEAVNRGAQKILLDINSPGGTVSGTPELAAKIDNLAGAFDIFSFNRSCCASAAEYLSAGVTARFATQSAINGSIGTILQTMDVSKMLEKFGVKVHTFASGKYKGMGNPYQEMTEDQKDFLKSWIKNLGAEFADHMQTHRREMQADHFQGQTFTTKEAVSIGLLDESVRSRNEVLEMI